MPDRRDVRRDLFGAVFLCVGIIINLFGMLTGVQLMAALGMLFVVIGVAAWTLPSWRPGGR